MRWGGPVLMAALLACGRKSTPTERSAPSIAPVASQAIPVVSVVASAAAEEPLRTSSAAVFKGDKLAACLDLALVSPGIERAFAASKIDASIETAVEDDSRVFISGGDSIVGQLVNATHGKGRAARLAVGGEAQVLTKPCGEQFAGRTVIASCRVQLRYRKDGGPEARLGFEIKHFDALASDKSMQACLAVKGEWTELPKDSLQFRNQKHHQLLDDSLKAIQ